MDSTFKYLVIIIWCYCRRRKIEQLLLLIIYRRAVQVQCDYTWDPCISTLLKKCYEESLSLSARLRTSFTNFRIFASFVVAVSWIFFFFLSPPPKDRGYPADDGQRDWAIQRIWFHIGNNFKYFIDDALVFSSNLSLNFFAVDKVCRCRMCKKGLGATEWLWVGWSSNESGACYRALGLINSQLLPGQRWTGEDWHWPRHYRTPTADGSTGWRCVNCFFGIEIFYKLFFCHRTVTTLIVCNWLLRLVVL